MRASSTDDFSPTSTSPILREATPPPSQLDHRQAFYNFSMTRTASPFVNQSSSPRPREIQNSPPIDAVTTVVKACKHCTFPFRAIQDLISVVDQDYCSKECRVCHQWFMKPSVSSNHVPLRQPSTHAGTKFVVPPRQASSHAMVPNVSSIRPGPLTRQISLPEKLTELPITSTGNLLTLLTKPTQMPTLPLVTPIPSNTSNVVSAPSTTASILCEEKIISSKTETYGAVSTVCSHEQLSSKEKQQLWEDSLPHSLGKEKVANQGTGTDKDPFVVPHKPINTSGKNSSPNKNVSPIPLNKNKLAVDKINTSSVSCSNELLRSNPPSLVPSVLLSQNGPTFTPTPPLAHELRTSSGGVGASTGRINYKPALESPKTETAIESSGTIDGGSKSGPKSPHNELVIQTNNSAEFSDESDPMGLEGDRVQTWRDRFSDAGSINGSCSNSIHTSGGIFTLKDNTATKPFVEIDRVDTERDNDGYGSLRMSSNKTGITDLMGAGTNASPRIRVNLKEMASSAAEWLFTPKQPKSHQRPQLHLYY